MPAFATHEIFGEEACELLFENEIGQAIEKHKGVFRTGCQGPDIFFYNPFMGMGGKKLSLGSRMHETRMNAFFKAYLEELLEIRERFALETGISYFLGFLCHYSLDVQMHPYVYSRCGYDAAHPEDGKKLLPVHQRLEAVIDKQMLMAKKNCMPSAYYPEKRIIITKKELEVIADIMSRTLTRVYHLGVRPENIKASYWSMRTAMKQVYDHSGKRKEKISRFENLILRKDLIGNMVVNDDLQDTMDAMNQKNSPWAHPWEKGESYCTHVWQMYDDALEDFQNYVEGVKPMLTGMFQRIMLIEQQKSRAEMVTDALREEIPRSAKVIGNKSYHSGK